MQAITSATSNGSVNVLSVNIPSTFANVLLIFSGRSSDTTGVYNDLTATFNSNTSAVYSYQIWEANNTTVSQSSAVAQTGVLIGRCINDGAAASYASQLRIDCLNYANTTFFKTIYGFSTVVTATASQGRLMNSAGSWANTAAISSITLTLSAGNFKAGSTLWAYGY